MLLKQKINQYYRLMMCFVLTCTLILASAELGKSQVVSDPTSQQTNTNSTSQTNSTISTPQSSSPTPQVNSVTPPPSSSPSTFAPQNSTVNSTQQDDGPFVSDIGPREVYVNAPQSLLSLLSLEALETQANNSKGISKKSLNQINPIKVIVSGDRFPKEKEKIVLKVGDVPAQTTSVATNGKTFFAMFDRNQTNRLKRGTYPISVEIEENIVPINVASNSIEDKKLEVKVTRDPSHGITAFLVVLALFSTLLLITIIFCLAQPQYSVDIPLRCTREGKSKKLNTLERIILDRETNTFSLARTQFVWWLTIIVFGYIFLLIGRMLVQGVWEFFPLSGFAYTFLISLGTLLGAQLTAGIRGNKGSGEVHPAYSDLIGHGGVVALERVQQVVWNIIIGIVFVVILIGTYATASSLPTIPNELLVLMGISSAGYLGGKAIRGPGPNINRVELNGKIDKLETDPYLSISGEHLSQGANLEREGNSVLQEDLEKRKDGGVIIQMVFLEVSKDNSIRKEVKASLINVQKDSITTKDLDPDAPNVFCRELRIDFKKLSDQKTVTDDWLKKCSTKYANQELKITVINADGQKAVWDGSANAPASLQQKTLTTNTQVL